MGPPLADCKSQTELIAVEQYMNSNSVPASDLTCKAVNSLSIACLSGPVYCKLISFSIASMH